MITWPMLLVVMPTHRSVTIYSRFETLERNHLREGNTR